MSLLLLYTILIWRIRSTWMSLKDVDVQEDIPSKTSFTIIIPFRNEADHLEDCLASLANLNYPNNLYEIILVNDHSTDDFEKMVTKLNMGNIRFITNEGQGKKAALTFAISRASKEYILTSDADCVFSPKWLQAYDNLIKETSPSMVAGSVAISQGKDLLNNFQSIEMAATMAINAHGITNQEFYICNGANLCFRKEVFLEVNGYQGNEHIASGDDVFLMSKMAALYPNEIYFLKSKDAVVKTKAMDSWSSFIHQRIRWAAKTKSYASSAILLTQSVVFLINLLCILLPVFLFFDFSTFSFLGFLCFMSIKLGIDYLFLKEANSFYHNQIKNIFLSFYLYAFYIVGMAFTALFLHRYTWKGRYGK